MAEQMQPMSYAEVLNLYKRVQDHPAVRGMQMPQFAQKLNELTGTERFSAGVDDNWLKRASVGFDQALQKTGVPQVSGDFFESLGNFIDPSLGPTARTIGEGLPRSVIETVGIPLAFVNPAVGIPLAAAGTLSAFGRGYTDSGSKAVGAIQAGANLAMPVAGRAGARFLTGPLSKSVFKATDSNVAARAVDFAGESLGAAALMEAANAAQLGVTGRINEYNPFSAENLFQQVAGQIVFTPIALAQVMKGPGQGKFGSVGQQLAADEFTKQKMAEAQLQKEKFVNTAESSEPDIFHVKPREQLFNQAAQFSKLGRPSREVQFLQPNEDLIRTIVGGGEKVASGDLPILDSPFKTVDRRERTVEEGEVGLVEKVQRGDIRERTLFGLSIEDALSVATPQKRSVSPGVPLLSGGQPDVFYADVNQNLVRQLVTGGLPSEAQNPLEMNFYAKPRQELVDLASKIISEGRAKKGADGLREAAEATNAIAAKNGDPPPITDAELDAKITTHTGNGRSEDEATQRVAQAVENKLNEEAGKLTTKVKNELEAQNRLAGLPEPHKAIIGEAIAAANTAIASDQFSDVISSQFVKAGLNWYEQNAPKLNDPTTSSPEGKTKVVKEITASLLKNKQKIVGDYQKTKEGRTTEEGTGTIRIGEMSAADTRALSNFGADAFVAEEQAAVSTVAELMTSSLTQAEATEVGLTSDHTKASAVLQAIASSAQFGTAGGKSKKGFKFVITPEVRQAFGNVKDSTIQDWVTKNLSKLRTVMELRLRQNGVDLMAGGEFSKNELFRYFEPFNPEHGAPAGSLPASAQRFFMRYFLAAGHTVDDAGKFANVAMSVAAQFKQIDSIYIAELVNRSDRNLLGVSQSSVRDKTLGIVGINLLEKVAPDAPGFNAFAKLLTFGHELYHQLWNVNTDVLSSSATAKGYRLLTQLAKHVEETPVEDRRAILMSLFEAVIPGKLWQNKDVLEFVAGQMPHVVEDPQEFVATYAGLLALGAAKPNKMGAVSLSKFKEEILYSDKFFSDFANGFYTDLREIAGALKDLAVLGGAQRTNAAKVIDSMHETFAELARTREQVEAAVARLRQMQNGMPEHFLKMVELAQHPPIVAQEMFGEVELKNLLKKTFPNGGEVKDTVTNFMMLSGLKKFTSGRKAAKELEPYTGKHPTFYQRNLMIPAHLRELYPIFNDVTDLVFSFRGRNNNWLTRAMLPFGRMNSQNKLTFDKTDPLIQIRNNPKLEKAISQVFLEQNEQKKRLSVEEMESLTEFQALSPDDKAIVARGVEQTHQSMGMAVELIKEFKKKTIADTFATTILSRVPGMKAKKSIAIGEQLTEAMFLAADPTTATQGQAALAALAPQVGPEVMVRLQNAFGGLLPKYQKLVEKLEPQRSYFTPETRLGKFYARFIKNGQNHFVGLEDAVAANEFRSRLEGDAAVDKSSIRIISKFDKQKDVNILYGDVVNSFADIERTAYEQSLQELRETNPDAADVVAKAYTPGEAVFKEVAARGFGKHFLPHSSRPGREEINMMHGVVAYLEGMSMGMSKAVTKRRASLLLADPEMKANPAVRNLASDYVLTVVEPPASEWTKVKSMAFHYFLGGNLSSLVIEGFQPLATLAPELTRRGAGIAGSYKLIAEAELEMARVYMGKESTLPKEWRLNDALARAYDEQHLDFGTAQEMEGMDVDTALSSLRRTSFSSDPLAATDLVKKPLYWYLHGTRSLYRGASSHNAKVAFVSGFINALKKGMDWESAYSEGVRTTQASMFGGGAASRPIGLFAKSGKFYGAVGALYTLRHYSVSMLSNWYRLGMEAIGKTGLNPSDKSQARKALGQMVSTQVLMSGALGLPMASAALSIMEQVFPDAELKAGLREGLAGLFGGDDNEMGGFVSDMALKGVISASLPIDVSSRFGLGDLFGLDPNKGAQWDAVFGAPGSILERWVGGASQVSQGNIVEATRQLMPNSFSNLIKMYDDDFKVRDKQGNLIYDPTETEVIASLVGFKPKRLSHYREEQALVERSDEIARRQLKEFHSGLADILLRGGTAEVREALLSRAHEDDMYDLRAGLRSVVEAAQKQLVPQDLTRTGSRGSIREREAISQAIPGQMGGRPSEVQLLTQRKQMEASVGLPGVGRLSRAELNRAQVVDYLMGLNPTWTRQHALIVAERMGGRN